MKRNSRATLSAAMLAISLLATQCAPGEKSDKSGKSDGSEKIEKIEKIDKSSPGWAQLGENTTIVDAFEDGKGGYVLIMGDEPEGWPSMGVDVRNEKYYVLSGGGSGSSVEYSMWFLEPRAKTTSKIVVDKQGVTLLCDDAKIPLKRVSKETLARLKGEFAAAPLVPYPDARRTEYLFKIKGRDEYIYVDAFRNNFTYETMRFFLGKKGKLKQIKIRGVKRGGSTFIMVGLFPGEVLYAPALHNGKDPYFETKGEKLPLERLDADTFDLAALGVNTDEMKLGDVVTPCSGAIATGSSEEQLAAAIEEGRSQQEKQLAELKAKLDALNKQNDVGGDGAASAPATEGPSSSEVQQPGTKLFWLRCPIGQTASDSECIGDAKEMNRIPTIVCPSGYRFPTRQEFVDLLGGCDSEVTSGNYGYCKKCSESGICSSMFPSDAGWYWSSSLYDEDSAWTANFDDGSVYRDSVGSYRYFRCVRLGCSRSSKSAAFRSR